MDHENDFARSCEEAVREVAADALADGRARLERFEHANGDWIELIPKRVAACPLTVTPHGPGPGELSIGVGRHGGWFEAWGPPDENLALLRRVIEAVVAGRYEEFFRERKVIGRLLLDAGPWIFSHNTLARWPPRSRQWNREVYEAY